MRTAHFRRRRTSLAAELSCVLIVVPVLASVAQAYDGPRVVTSRPAITEARRDAAHVIHVAPPRESLPAPGEGVESGDAGEKLAYRNALGKNLIELRENFLLADDLATRAGNGSELRRYRIWVTGEADPADGTAGPYTLEFGLYDICPGANGPGSAQPIPGTSGTVSIVDPAQVGELVEIEFVAEPGVAIPTSVWFGVSSSRDNVGILAGSPAEHGFTDDALDYPGYACAASLGGYPTNAHASVNLELFVNADAQDVFIAYRNIGNVSRAEPGHNAGVRLADDVELVIDSCNIASYEVGVRGRASYQFDLRRLVDEPPLEGTTGSRSNSTEPGFVLVRKNLDSPVPVTSPRMFVTMGMNTSVGGWTLPGQNATSGKLPTVGESSHTFLKKSGDGEFVETAPRDGSEGSFYIVIYCEGDPPIGACCDMVETDEVGDAVCRDVAEVNCNWPPRRTSLDPTWRQGVSCSVCDGGENAGLACQSDEDCAGGTCIDNEAFFPRVCGQSACCLPEGGCENLTKNECDAVEPLRFTRLWQRGRFCASQGQRCPSVVCIGRCGDCIEPRPRFCNGGTRNGEDCSSDAECPGSGNNGLCELSDFTCIGGARDGAFCEGDRDCLEAFCDFQRGCDAPLCCTEVCGMDSFCCTDEWDEVCAQRAADTCGLLPEFDRCASGDGFDGARRVEIGGFFIRRLNSNAESSTFEPGFCCHTGDVRRCIGGGPPTEGDPCVSQDDCDGFCPPTDETPGAQAAVTVWFKFTVPEAQGPADPATISLKLSTCGSNSPADDSLMQVFEAPRSDAGVCARAGELPDGTPCTLSTDECSFDMECQAVRVECSVSAQDCPNDLACVPDLENECGHLVTIGCNDDAGELCPSRPRNSVLCLDQLERGRTYYVMLGVKDDGNETPYGDYRLDLIPVFACPAGETPENDYCARAADITEGEHPLDVSAASPGCTLGTDPACRGNAATPDVWYRYTAPRTGCVSIETCSDAAPAAGVTVFDGCDCPATSATPTPAADRFPLACEGDAPAGCLFGTSIQRIPVTSGQCLLIRASRYVPTADVATLSIGFEDHECVTQNTCCPSDGIEWLWPPDGAIDARDPFRNPGPDGFSGITEILIRSPLPLREECWQITETEPAEPNEPLTIPAAPPNAIRSITHEGDDNYRIALDRPITPGACTTLTYAVEEGAEASARFCALPGDVGGNGCTGPPDIVALIDALNGKKSPPFGTLSGNCDGNSATGPSDISCIIDLMNAGWLGVCLPPSE